ncbi:hypothetical protein LTS10_001079 [Elasticomyces elasticus]|nr:hypothetical protein LTS10_001079 [Elasticomyces elasticus]
MSCQYHASRTYATHGSSIGEIQQHGETDIWQSKNEIEPDAEDGTQEIIYVWISAVDDVSDPTDAATSPVDHVFAPKLGPTAYADPSEANTCDLAFRAHGKEEFNSSLDGNGATASPQATQSIARAKRLRDIQQQFEAVPEGRVLAGYLELVQAHRLTMLWHQGCDTDDLTSRSVVTDSDVWN